MASRASKVDFSEVRWGSVEWTALCTLYLRACESRLPDSILGDRAAADAMDRISYDFDRIRRYVRPGSNQFLVALRAKQFDTWTTDFLSRYPAAVVVHLGCGLDSRAFRVAPPARVQWFDIDLPAVAALRHSIYPQRPGYQISGSSVTDEDWLGQIPPDQPTLIVAEGLLPYLSQTQVRRLLMRLTDRFGTGELLADVLSPWGPRISKLATSGIVTWGTRDGRELQRWNPRLHYLDHTSAMADYAKIPLPAQRTLYRVLYAVPAIRDYDRLYRFAF